MLYHESALGDRMPPLVLKELVPVRARWRPTPEPGGALLLEHRPKGDDEPPPAAAAAGDDDTATVGSASAARDGPPPRARGELLHYFTRRLASDRIAAAAALAALPAPRLPVERRGPAARAPPDAQGLGGRGAVLAGALVARRIWQRPERRRRGRDEERRAAGNGAVERRGRLERGAERRHEPQPAHGAALGPRPRVLVGEGVDEVLRRRLAEPGHGQLDAVGGVLLREHVVEVDLRAHDVVVVARVVLVVADELDLVLERAGGGAARGAHRKLGAALLEVLLAAKHSATFLPRPPVGRASRSLTWSTLRLSEPRETD